MKTAIPPFTESWNYVVGCTKTSPGCAECWAEAFATRACANPDLPSRYLYAGAATPEGWTGRLVAFPARTAEPYTWRTPRLCFALSQTDPGHLHFRPEWLALLVDTAVTLPQHVFAALSKRPIRLFGRLRALGYSQPANLWLGTSIEADPWAYRLRDLVTLGDADLPAGSPPGKSPHHYWLSAEPLLEPLLLSRAQLIRLGLVVCGGENGHRECPPTAVRRLRDLCAAAAVPFYFKSWGAYWRDRQDQLPAGCAWPDVLDGRSWRQLPPEWSALQPTVVAQPSPATPSRRGPQPTSTSPEAPHA